MVVGGGLQSRFFLAGVPSGRWNLWTPLLMTRHNFPRLSSEVPQASLPWRDAVETYPAEYGEGRAKK